MVEGNQLSGRFLAVVQGCLLAVGIPLVLPVQLPAKKARFMLPLIRATPQYQGVLLPDAAAGQVKPASLNALRKFSPWVSAWNT